MIDSDSIARARAVRVASEIHRRGIKLRRQGKELVGPCPVCGGTDRFAVHTVKNTFICRRCSAGGDVIALVQHLDGVDFREAVSRLSGGPSERFSTPGAPRLPPVHANASTDAQDAISGHRQAMRLWGEAVPISGTLAERYLIEVRKLVLPPDASPRVLRFHPRCPFGPGVHHPCLIALYRDVITDAPRAIMRTALTSDARKIDRKALGPVGGAAIKLSADEDVTQGLVIGEGLETTLSGMVFGFAPAWALGSAGAIAKFPVLAGIEALTILAETDDDGANERAIRECFARWNAAGREVYRVTPLTGGDMNGALMTKGQAA